nr:chromatin structure-remodeling complex protein SYD isoform X3 [Tanacetum cinerariifolium]
MKVNEVPKHVVVPGIGGKQKGELGNLDNQHYGRGKRAREVGLFVLVGSDADAIAAAVSAATSVLGVDVFICLVGLFLVIAS